MADRSVYINLYSLSVYYVNCQCLLGYTFFTIHVLLSYLQWLFEQKSLFEYLFIYLILIAEDISEKQLHTSVELNYLCTEKAYIAVV